jgi:hypothetical protein
MHRWVWDLRGPPPIASEHDYPISAAPHATPRAPRGPRVLPGTYTVVLTANGKALTAKLEVRLDPRTKLAGNVVAAQHELEVHLARLLASSSQLIMETRSVEEQLARLGARVDAQAAEVAAIADGPKQRVAGTYAPTVHGVGGAIAGLYGAIDVDAAPTAAALEAAKTAERELDALRKRWDDWKAGPLVTLNRDLESAGLAPIKPELRPSARPVSGDED